MRSLVLFLSARGWLWSALVALVMMFGVATSSTAEFISQGTLGLQVTTNPPLETNLLNAPVVPTLAVRDGSGQLTKVGFPVTVFSTANLTLPVTDPAAAPISGLALTVKNDAGTFTRVGAVPKFGGTMPLKGKTRVCLFSPCDAIFVGDLAVPISPVGGPVGPPNGTAYAVGGGLAITVKGAPWTQGPITLGTADGGTEMHAGNFANDTQTTMGATYKNIVQLVTPVFVSTNIGASAVVPIYGTLRFTIPEPGTVAAIGAAFISLVAMGVARRR